MNRFEDESQFSNQGGETNPEGQTGKRPGRKGNPEFQDPVTGKRDLKKYMRFYRTGDTGKHKPGPKGTPERPSQYDDPAGYHKDYYKKVRSPKRQKPTDNE